MHATAWSSMASTRKPARRSRERELSSVAVERSWRYSRARPRGERFCWSRPQANVFVGICSYDLDMTYNFQVAVDCADPHVLADWWAETLGWVVESSDPVFIQK